MAQTTTNVGLIAGQGRLPVLVADGIRAAGGRVLCVGLAGHFDPDLPEHCDVFKTAGVLRLGRWIRLFRGWGIGETVMVGRVSKKRMHDPLRVVRQLPDWRAARLWYRRLRHDRRSPALLAALADELADNGIHLIDSTTYIPEHLAVEGLLGAVKPTAAQNEDMAFGWPILKDVVRLGVGQSIAVRERDVIAVEAVEGTDAMIDRAGTLCRASGWTLLKTAPPDHDMRADVPTIGVHTIERFAAAGGRCIAVGVGKVILIDKPAVIEAANKAKVALVGVW